MDKISTHDFALELPGVPIEMQSVAKEDIRELANGIAGAADTLGIPFLLQRIRLTDRFEDDVNQLLQQRSGITGYTAARHNAHAVAKTIWTRSLAGDFGFSVVIDVDGMGPWNLNNPRCLTTVLHELSHVLCEVRHLKRLGEEEYTAIGDTRERWLDRWATLILDEFVVDRLVDNIVRGIASKDDGQPCSLRELEESQGIDWIGGLLDRYVQMPQFIDEKVWQFRTSQIEIGDMAAAVIPAVQDLLTLLSHTASKYLGTERWPEVVERVKDTEACHRFFKENLDVILGQFDDSQLPFEESVQIVAQATERIFGYCGLRFETIPEGVYIAVDAPSR